MSAKPSRGRVKQAFESESGVQQRHLDWRYIFGNCEYLGAFNAVSRDDPINAGSLGREEEMTKDKTCEKESQGSVLSWMLSVEGVIKVKGMVNCINESSQGRLHHRKSCFIDDEAQPKEAAADPNMSQQR